MNIHCPTCGYDLQGAPGPFCPECGVVFHPDIIAKRIELAHLSRFSFALRLCQPALIGLVTGSHTLFSRDLLEPGLFTTCACVGIPVAVFVLTANTYDLARRLRYVRTAAFGKRPYSTFGRLGQTAGLVIGQVLIYIILGFVVANILFLIAPPGQM